MNIQFGAFSRVSLVNDPQLKSPLVAPQDKQDALEAIVRAYGGKAVGSIYGGPLLLATGEDAVTIQRKGEELDRQFPKRADGSHSSAWKNAFAGWLATVVPDAGALPKRIFAAERMQNGAITIMEIG